MKKVLNHLIIRDDLIFGAYVLLAIPFSIFVIWLDKDTKSVTAIFDHPPGELTLIVLFIFAMALMIGFLTNILFNVFRAHGSRFDAFCSALLVGFFVNLVLMFVGLLVLWPVLLPAVITMMVLSYARYRKDQRLPTQ